jgi:glycosyltransferase involved in cell wall biosynthesis
MLRLANIVNIPSLIFPRSGYIIENFYASKIHKIITSLAIGNASKFLCQGKLWKKFAINELNYEVENTSIIYNWTASKDLLKVGENKNNNSHKETTKILFLGWLDEEKGIFELLHVFVQLSKEFRVELFVAGRGNSESKIKSLVRSNHLQESVHLLGWVNETVKISLLKESDIFILPSWTEGFPNALIEAMSAKVAVIATDVGNISDVLTDRQEILLVPPKSNQILKEAVQYLINDKEFRISLADKGYNFARENFSVDVGITKLKENIIDTIQNNKM